MSDLLWFTASAKCFAWRTAYNFDERFGTLVNGFLKGRDGQYLNVLLNLFFII